MTGWKRMLWFFFIVLSFAATLAVCFYGSVDAMPEWKNVIWKDDGGTEYLFLPSWYGIDTEAVVSSGWKLRMDIDDVAVGDDVQILCASNFPTVQITTESGGMDNFRKGKEIRENGTISLIDVDGSVLFQGELGEIRARGNVTFNMEKQSFQFKLQKTENLLGMGTSQTWLLLADFLDETGLRNAIALDMAAAAGMEYVTQWRAVNLYCNSVYWGCYLLTEKVEVGRNRVDIVKGFLLERELPERFEEEQGFISEKGDCYVQHYPENGSGVEKAAALINAFEAAVWEADGKNPQTGTYYVEYIDLDSFVKKYILEEILLNYDAGVTSAYYYIDENDIIFAGPPWDYDAAIGNCYVNEMIQDPETLALGKQHADGTGLYEALWSHADFRERVAEIYEVDFRPHLEKLLKEGLDDYEAYFSASWFMNSVRWKDSGNPNRYYKNYENEIRYLKYFLDRREKFLDKVWLGKENAADRSALWKTGEMHQIIYAVDGEVWRLDEVEDGTLLEELPYPEEYEEYEIKWRKDETELEFVFNRPLFEDEILILEMRY